MSIPISSVKPEATWVSEGAGSLKQKHTVTGKVTFTHFKLRCEVATTMEASVMAISAFENLLVKQVSEAMIKAIENAIINGAYDSVASAYVGPKGILNETPEAGQIVEIAADGGLSFETLTEAEGKLPLAYENGAVYFMTKKTFMEFMSMTDKDDQPIARVNYGLAGAPERTLLGRKVILNEYMESYKSSVEADTVFAFLFNPADYTLNTNYNMGIQKKQDWDTEDLLTKAVMAVDGKVVDKNSLVVLKKKQLIDTTLKTLKVGSSTIELVEDVTEYQHTTTDASNTITAIANNEEADVAIAFGEKDDYESGNNLTWEVDDNEVTITVSVGEEKTVYTLTVTYEG